jgi:hypothetical protein
LHEHYLQTPLCLPLFSLLAEAKLEDVLRSAQQNMNEGPGAGRLIALLLGAIAIFVLLAVLQQQRKRSAIPKPVNHQGRLLKEVLPALPLKKAELKQLKRLADEQSYCSPLILVLCPSLLNGAVQKCDPAERESVERLVGKIVASRD